MRQILSTAGIAALLMLPFAAASFAQDAGRPGAGRWEVTAFPAGGIFFTEGDRADAADFGEYEIGASVTYNFNRRLGFEGEFGGGISVDQTLRLAGTTLSNASVPHSLAYNGNVIYNIVGSDRALVPYVAGGAGGLTLLSRDRVRSLLADDETFFTGNVGGGIRWFPSRHWGVRADYRFVAVKSKDDAPSFFGLEESRFGHRVFGGIVLTGGH